MKRLKHRKSVLLIAAFTTALSLAQAQAQDIEPPSANVNEPAVKISWTNKAGEQEKIVVTRSDMQAMQQTANRLQLPDALGISGSHNWQGVSLKQVVARSGYNTKVLQATALNGYFVEVPQDDLERFDPILAFRRDDQFISIREKGPFILIYPFNQFPELNQQRYINRTVWQIDELNLR